MIENISVRDSIVGKNVLEIINANQLRLKKINCSISNSTNENRSLIYKSVGGCIKTKNIYSREIENLIIFNAFSDTTSFGIKIIDENDYLSQNNSTAFEIKVCFLNILYNKFIKIIKKGSYL